MANQIWRDEDNEGALKAVEKSSMFENNAHFLTFCAHYGVSINKKKKIKNRGPEIAIKTFQPYLKDIFIVALSHKQDIKLLYDEGACHEIFEQYANGGLTEISKMINKKLGSDPEGIDTITTLLQDLRNKITSIEDEDDLSLPSV